jgi:hypothetical protein
MVCDHVGCRTILCLEFGSGKKLDVKYFEEKFSMLRSHKCEDPALMKYQIVKRQRIDCSLASECSTTLKQEMTHLGSCVFNQPASRQACLTEHLSVSQMSNSDLDYDGLFYHKYVIFYNISPLSNFGLLLVMICRDYKCLDDENSCLCSQHTPATMDFVAL